MHLNYNWLLNYVRKCHVARLFILVATIAATSRNCLLANLGCDQLGDSMSISASQIPPEALVIEMTPPMVDVIMDKACIRLLAKSIKDQFTLFHGEVNLWATRAWLKNMESTFGYISCSNTKSRVSYMTSSWSSNYLVGHVEDYPWRLRYYLVVLQGGLWATILPCLLPHSTSSGVSKSYTRWLQYYGI